MSACTGTSALWRQRFLSNCTALLYALFPRRNAGYKAMCRERKNGHDYARYRSAFSMKKTRATWFRPLLPIKRAGSEGMVVIEKSLRYSCFCYRTYYYRAVFDYRIFLLTAFCLFRYGICTNYLRYRTSKKIKSAGLYRKSYRRYCWYQRDPCA